MEEAPDPLPSLIQESQKFAVVNLLQELRVGGVGFLRIRLLVEFRIFPQRKK